MHVQLRRALLRFYGRQRRDLPWRHTRDPYAIWISEIMLQQTQVETVVPRYRRFLQEFPTVTALANATCERVCEAWAGLGYYRRARNLHRAACLVAEAHDGALPRSAKELERLPGIGRYTAGAIASIAFDEAAAVVDGNVTRVLARLFVLPGRVGERSLSNSVWRLAGELVVGPRPGDLNQALMELGATVCKPTAPACDRCPVERFCKAKASGEPTRYPEPAVAPPTRDLPMALALVRDAKGVWLRQRSLQGLWAGLWELPSAEGPRARVRLAKELGVPLRVEVARVTHLLTHRRVLARVYLAAPAAPAALGLKAYAQPLDAPLSALARKALRATVAQG